MKKLVLAGFSLLAVGLLVLVSLSNVVGYQTIKASREATINESVNLKDLLFQTICDMANNKEMWKIISATQFNLRGFSFGHPTLTKRDLEGFYLTGQFISKMMNKTTMVSRLNQLQGIMNPSIRKGIDSVIEKDARLSGELTQLSALDCNCQTGKESWHFPVICLILFKIATYYRYYLAYFYFGNLINWFIFGIFLCILGIEGYLHCPYYYRNY